MKVLYYNHTGELLGAERLLLSTLAEIDPKKFNLKLLCPRGSELERLANEAGIPVKVTRSLHARFTWRPDRWMGILKSFVETLQSFRGQVIRESPDLIHANSILSGMAALLATMMLRTPVIWHLHQPPRKCLLNRLLRWIAVLTPRVYLLAGSKFMLESFLGALLTQFNPGRRRMRVIPPGVKLQHYVRDVDSAREVRRRLGIGLDRFVVGALGAVTPLRGQLELIEAFARTELSDSILLIAGRAMSDDDRRYLNRLVERASELGLADRVRFLDEPEDKASLIRSLDLMASTPTGDVYDLDLVEAMACGVPVLAAAVDGVRDLIHHGSNGLLVPSGDGARLSRALTTLRYARELRRKLSVNAAHQTVPQFAFARALNSVEEYYQLTRPTTAQPAKVTLAA